MADQTAAFNSAAERVKTLATAPSNEVLLELYALFKQATVGDVNTDRPGFMDFKGRAKWDVRCLVLRQRCGGVEGLCRAHRALFFSHPRKIFRAHTRTAGVGKEKGTLDGECAIRVYCAGCKPFVNNHNLCSSVFKWQRQPCVRHVCAPAISWISKKQSGRPGGKLQV